MNAQWNALLESGGWIYLLPFVAAICGAVGYIRSIRVTADPMPPSRIIHGDELAEGMTVLLDCRGSRCRYAGEHGPTAVHPLTVLRMRLSGSYRYPVLSDDLSGTEHDMAPVYRNETLRVTGGPVQTVSLGLSADLSGTCLADRADLSADLSAPPSTGLSARQADLSARPVHAD